MDKNNIFYVYVYCDPRKPGTYVYGNYIFEHEPFYVGKGCNGRSHTHLYLNDKHIYNNHFYNKIKKIQREHKSDPFIIKVNEGITEDISFEIERELICVIGRYDLKLGPLCNLTDGGEGASGHIMSEEIRQKISKIHKGKIVSEETKRKLSKSTKKYMSNEEIRQKVSSAMKGRSISEETRQKMSEASKGRKHTEEAKRKIGKAHKGKPLSEEHKQKVSEAKKGKAVSEETRRKMSITRKGRIVTEETKRKISETMKKRIQNHV